MDKEKNFNWANQKVAKNCEVIECKKHDTYKDFIMDDSGFYVLIRPNFEYYAIDVGVCNMKSHEMVVVFRGRTPQDIYHEIFRYEKANNVQIFKEKTHIAYLGKELKKAEIALAQGQNSYFQE